MRIDKKANRRRAGLSNYQKRVEKVGLENIKEIGRMNSLKRKTFRGGCNDPEFASKIGKLGGKVGRRGRKFTPDTEMTDEEWSTLRRLANTAAGNLRMVGRTTAIDQHTLVSLNLQNAYEHQDWMWVMRSGLELPEWYNALGNAIEQDRLSYVSYLKLGTELTEPQEREFKNIRNIKSAWKTAGEGQYGETQREAHSWVVR